MGSNQKTSSLIKNDIKHCVKKFNGPWHKPARKQGRIT